MQSTMNSPERRLEQTVGAQTYHVASRVGPARRVKVQSGRCDRRELERRRRRSEREWKTSLCSQSTFSIGVLINWDALARD